MCMMHKYQPADRDSGMSVPKQDTAILVQMGIARKIHASCCLGPLPLQGQPGVGSFAAMFNGSVLILENYEPSHVCKKIVTSVVGARQATRAKASYLRSRAAAVSVSQTDVLSLVFDMRSTSAGNIMS